MKASDQPTRIAVPFADSAGTNYIRTIPVPSQIGTTNGAASFTDGFPPDTFVPEGAGGYPPDGRDFNGLLNLLSAWIRWNNSGGPAVYDATFSASIGGYPSGAVLLKADGSGLWESTADDNTTDPDSGGAGWATLAQSQSAADGRYAKLAGLNTQQFSVAAATSSAQAVNLGQFVSSLSSNGYKRIPDLSSPTGYTIRQWGNLTIAGPYSSAIVFPVAFPNQALSFTITSWSGPMGNIYADSAPSLTGITVDTVDGNAHLAGWTAEGY